MEKYIEGQLEELSKQLQLLKHLSSQVIEIVKICVNVLKRGNKIIFCGNGGSASQSQHLAAELVGRYKLNRPALNALSLTVDTSNLTAISNDYGYDFVFSRQLEGVGKEGDILFGLSTSGNSKNICLAFEKAHQMGITTFALVGKNGGKMAELADCTLMVPAETSAYIQEMHLAIGHLVCDLIERSFYGK